MQRSLLLLVVGVCCAVALVASTTGIFRVVHAAGDDDDETTMKEVPMKAKEEEVPTVPRKKPPREPVKDYGEVTHDALLRALAADDEASALDLLAHGHSPNASHRGIRAIHLAASKGMAKVVEALCDAHVQVELLSADGEYPIHGATFHGHLDTLKVLLEHCKEDPHTQTPPGFTALHVAAMKGRTDIAKYLLETPLFQGVTTLNDYGDSALHAAIKAFSEDVAWLLMTNKDKPSQLDLPGSSQWTPFLLSAFIGNVTFLKHLAESGVNIHALNEDQETALHRAVQHRHPEATKFLIDELHFPVDPLDSWEWTPLHFAARFGYTELVEILLERGADPRKREKKGRDIVSLTMRSRHISDDVKKEISDILQKHIDKLGGLLPPTPTPTPTPPSSSVSSSPPDTAASGDKMNTKTEL